MLAIKYSLLQQLDNPNYKFLRKILNRHVFHVISDLPEKETYRRVIFDILNKCNINTNNFAVLHTYEKDKYKLYNQYILNVIKNNNIQVLYTNQQKDVHLRSLGIPVVLL